MSPKRLGLIAGLTFLLALLLPCIARAGEINGTWDGLVTFQIVQYGFGPPISASGSYFGEMSLDYIDTPTEHEFTESIGATTIIGDQFVNPSLFFLNDPFGPNSASGSVLGDVTANPGYLGYPVGDFAVNYQSILPDGAIDTSSGSADGDMFLAMGHPILFGETVFVSFQTVPEPSSMVLAGAALLMTGIFEWMRRFRPRPCSSYNYKSWLRRINPTPQHPAQVIRTGLADEGRYDEPFQGQKRR